MMIMMTLFMPGTVLSASQMLIHSVLRSDPEKHHCTDEETGMLRYYNTVAI